MEHLKSAMLITLLTFLSISTSINGQETGGPYTTDANTILLMHFDGNLTNNSSLSGDGNLQGSGASYSSDTPANLEQSFNLDGSSYVTVPHNSNLDLNGDWTLEAWIKITAFNSNTQSIIVRKPGDTDNYNSNYTFELHPWWGNILHGFYFSNEQTRINITGMSPTLNQWYHVAFIRDVTNSTISIIVHDEDWNVVSSSSQNYSGSDVLLNSKDLRIGEAFDGYIDELRISNVVRDFSTTLNKPQITSENFIIYYDSENSSDANTIITQLQNKTDFYKKYFKYFFTDHSKTFSINICKDLTEFNQFKPADLPDFETSYINQEILYLITPTTTAQQGYFDNFEQAAMHGFAMMFVDDEYNNTASEWMKYGFARHQSGMKSTPEEIRAEISNLGRNPTMAEMNNWDQITAFDKYAFAYTIFQYVADVHSFDYIFNQIRFNDNSVQYGFLEIHSEAEFEEAWYYSLDMFYLRETKRIEFQRETEHYYFYLVDEDMSEIDQWASELEEFYTRFTGDMQMTIDHKIHVFFYPELCDFHYIQGRDDCPTGSVGHSIAINLCSFTRRDAGVPMMNSIGLAKHEITHVIQGNLEYNSHKRWQSEGLATLMPDGLISEDIINGSTGVIKEQVNVEFSKIVAAAGRYPTIDDFESNDFVNTYEIDTGALYYLLGSVLVDYIIKTSGYLGLKNFILSDGSDYTTLGFTDKVDFMNSFYVFYEQNWKIPPQHVIANNVQAPINIDGNINESNWNLNQDIEGIYPFYQTWNYNSAKYGVLWDADYLYVAVEVLDNNLENNSSDGWNDGVEIFIDGDFNKAYQYDSFDRHFTKGWNNSGLTEKNNLTTGVLHSVQNISGGFTVEMAIPWSNLGITPTNGKTIGFDVANIVNRNGNKYQLIWSGNDINNGTTINFGELTLFFSNAPVVSNIPNQTTNEGESFTTINLDDFVTDSDNLDSEIDWSYSGNTDLSVSINSNRVATISTPNADWNGSETITFTATDPSGASDNDEATFTVTDSSPQPSSLSNNIIISSSYLGYDCQYRVYRPAGYNILSNLPTIYVTDGQNYLSNSKGKMVTTLDDLIADNIIEPVIAIFLDPRDPNNLSNDRRGFEYRNNINFVNYVTQELLPVIDAAYKTNTSSYARGIMGASYGGYNAEYFSVKASAYFKLFSMNSPYLHPNDGYNIDADLQAANLDSMKLYLSTGSSDADGVRYFNRLKGIYDSKGKEFESDIVSNGGHNWNTWSSVVANALFYFFPNSTSPPFVSNIPSQTIFEGNIFTSIQLDNYVTDSDNEDSEITWSFSGNNDLSVEVDGNRVATILIPHVDWFGREVITFTATDPSYASSSKDVTFLVLPVNDYPIISEAPELIEFVSDTNYTIDIWELVSDVETTDDLLAYEFSVDSDSILISYDNGTGILTLSAEIKFGGEGDLIWSVSDSAAIVVDTIHIAVEKAVIISVDDEMIIPNEYVLFQNYPNPFNPSTMVKYGIPEQSNIRIEVFNMLGQSVALLVNGNKSAGYYETTWNASSATGGLPSGIYLVSLRAEGLNSKKNFTQVKKALLLK
ncbi:MAG: T9SS type A sorting domain-containing protein [Melioribacteraceae bacterium]|nr:T9SS type A sorting domain-containing protein [Melioribacteraceae bacterium]